MTPKRTRVPSPSGSTRKPGTRSIQKKGKFGDPARSHAIVTDVSPEEKRAIIKHCLDKELSVSQYLAELLIADMEHNDTGDEDGEEITLRFTGPQMQKLRLLARISQKSTVHEMISDLVSPRLEHKRLHGPFQPSIIRFYVTRAEHKKVMRHIASKGISARNYVALLALEDIAKQKGPSSRHRKK